MTPKNIAALLMLAVYVTVGILLSGCAITQPRPLTAASLAAQSASVATSRASTSNASAKASVAKAREQVAQANAIATPGQAAILSDAQASLDSASAELDDTQAQLTKAESANEIREQQIDLMGSELITARKEVTKVIASRDYWCAWALRLSALVAGWLLWTLRDPVIKLGRSLIGLPSL